MAELDIQNLSGKFSKKWIYRGAAAAFLLLLLLVATPFAVVPAGNRGVLTTFGKVDDTVYTEGIHWRWPIAQKMHLVDVRIQKGEGEGEAASKDMQVVHTKVAVNFHLKPERVTETFRNVGNLDAVESRLILPAVQEAVKAATARYTAEELITKRPEVRDAIRMALNERLIKHDIIIDEFSIVNFQFSKSFNEAIEAKTTAEQLKLKAERDLQRIKVEAEQKIASAEAEAKSLAMQKQEVTAELLRLREVENQSKAIEKWDGKLPTYIAGGAIPFIQVPGTAK
ncbi:MAG: prohibitin family protein [Deltaproteobacteria bacterium]|nr:MAG: prohibitin family protein [Deltaproteobacteria bacterium]